MGPPPTVPRANPAAGNLGAKKSAEYGFLADVDQLEVDETADTLVLRGHGPKLSLTEAFQLAMGNSKYIYLVGHSAGKNVSGYTAESNTMVEAAGSRATYC